MILFLFGFSLCLNILFIFIFYYLYQNYKRNSPINIQNIALNKWHDVYDLFDIRDL